MLHRLRFFAFCFLVASAAFSLTAFADEPAYDDGGHGCSSNMLIQYRSNVTQGAAQTYCETLACADVCTTIGCSGGNNASAPDCTTCTHSHPGWTYASHGTCSCSPIGG